MGTLLELQLWYASNCDEEWEHQYGVQIDTLDNPGWSLEIDLTGTNLEDHSFAAVKIDISDDDWYSAHVVENQFKAYGDPHKLSVLIDLFLFWAKAENEAWLEPPPPLTVQEQERQDDLKFYQLLAQNEGTGKCHQSGCQETRVKHSKKCKDHHFEMVKKRSVPKTT